MMAALSFSCPSLFTSALPSDKLTKLHDQLCQVANLLTLNKLDLIRAFIAFTMQSNRSQPVCVHQQPGEKYREWEWRIYLALISSLLPAAFLSAYADIALCNLLGTVSTHTCTLVGTCVWSCSTTEHGHIFHFLSKWGFKLRFSVVLWCPDEAGNHKTLLINCHPKITTTSCDPLSCNGALVQFSQVQQA